MRRWILGIGTVVLGIIIALAAYGAYAAAQPRSQSKPSTSGRPLSLDQVQPAIVRTAPLGTTVGVGVKGAANHLPSAVTATGSVVANRRSSLGFAAPGLVVEVDVTEGQRVEAGQLLAREDDTTARFNVQQADYAVQAAQAALDKLLEPVDARDVADAEANVKAAEGGYIARAGAVSPATVKAYQLQYQQALAAAKAADYLRAGAGGQFATDDPNYLKSVAQVGIAQTNAEIARLKMEQATRGSSVESATANIAYAQAKLAQVKAGTRQIDVDDAQAQLATAKLQRDVAQHVQDNTRLVAPFAGLVTKVTIKQDELSGGPAILLTDDSELSVDVPVDESHVGKIQIGQPVQVTVEALPGALLTGKVQRIDQLANTTAPLITYVVRAGLDPTAAPVKIAMTAKVSFVSDTR